MTADRLPCGFAYPTYRCNMPESVHGSHAFVGVSVTEVSATTVAEYVREADAR